MAWRISGVQTLQKDILKVGDRVVLAEITAGSGGQLVVRNLLLQNKWRHIPKTWIRPWHNCQNWMNARNNIVVGILKIQKSGSSWNRFHTPILFDRIRFGFSCIGMSTGFAKADRSKLHQLIHRFQGFVQRPVHHLIQWMRKIEPKTWSHGLLLALLTGQKSEIPRETKHILQLSFLWHLFVISGMHVIWIYSCFRFLWTGITLRMRIHGGGLGIQLEVLGQIIFSGLFVAWFGFMSSALRSLIFFLGCAWLPMHWRGAGKSIHDFAFRVLMGLGLLILLPEFFFQIGFWMSWYAAIGIGFASHMLHGLRPLKSTFALLIFMNIWMLPWILFLSGILIWPVIFLSGMLCLIVSFLFMGQLLLSWVELFPQVNAWIEGLPEKVLAWSMQLPKVWLIVQPISEQCLWFVCGLFCCFGLVLARLRKPMTHLS